MDTFTHTFSWKEILISKEPDHYKCLLDAAPVIRAALKLLNMFLFCPEYDKSRIKYMNLILEEKKEYSDAAK